MSTRSQSIARLAAFGALAVAVGVLALYLLLVFWSRRTPVGGINQTHALITWISMAVPMAVVILAHLAFARMLFRHAQEQ